MAPQMRCLETKEYWTMAKILVVDDEKLLVKGMKFNLENEG